MGQCVLANTAPRGHEHINNTLEALQQEWSNLVARIIDTKVIFIYLPLNTYSLPLIRNANLKFVFSYYSQCWMSVYKNGLVS